MSAEPSGPIARAVRFEALSLRVDRRAAQRLIALRASLALIAVAALLIVARPKREPLWPLDLGLAAALLAVVGPLLFELARVVLPARWSSGLLEVYGQTRVQITRGGRGPTPLSGTIDAAWRDAPETVHLQLDDATLVTALLPSEDDAIALLQALPWTFRLDVPSMAASIPFGQTAGLITMLGLAILEVGILAALTKAPAPALLDVVPTAIAVALLIALTLHALLPRRIVVGIDGITIERGPRRRFVHYADIRSAYRLRRGILVMTAAGDEYTIVTSRWSGDDTAPDRREALAGAIEGASAHGDGLRIGDRVEAEVDATTAEYWHERYRRLARPGSYRTLRAAALDLEGIVEDPTASLPERIGALRVLLETGRPQTLILARRVATRTADPALRSAIGREIEDGETAGADAATTRGGVDDARNRP